MSGWSTIKAIRLLESEVDALGLEMVDPEEDNFSKYITTTVPSDRIALRPKGDSLPHYSRDAKVWIGTLEELQFWLRGVVWAREYDQMLKLSDGKARDNAESNERNRQLMSTIKKGKLVQGTRHGIEEGDVADEEVPF